MNSKRFAAPLQGRNNSSNAEYRNEDEELSFGLEVFFRLFVYTVYLDLDLWTSYIKIFKQ